MRQKERHRKIKVTRLDIVLCFVVVAAWLLYGGLHLQTEPADDGQAPAQQTEHPAETVPPTYTTEQETQTTTTEAQTETEPPAPELDEAEVEMLACAIYCEAGGDACSDLCRYYVGDVMLNRVDDPRFPDTLEGVLTQKGQYGRFYWTGIVWPERAKYDGEQAAVARAYDTARALLSGEHSELYGAGYIFQAEFVQGTDVIYLDGTYFGR